MILLLLALGALAYGIADRGSRGAPRRTRDPLTAIVHGEIPSPLAVLCRFVDAGLPPPETVVACAIAEADARGRSDLAALIAQRHLPTQSPPILSAILPPVDDVDPATWQAFVARLRRESPGYRTSRHVGQYRQRVERCRHLGLEPEELQADPDIQHAALAADVEDSYLRARATGELAQALVGYVDAGDGPCQITRSGYLGLCLAAGPEGAKSWIAEPDDRERFPHTTQIFRRVNGLF